MVRGRLCLIAPLLLAAAAAFAVAQTQYESQYGPTVDVSIDDLLTMPESYLNRNVKTRGVLEMVPTATRETYSLRGTFGGHVVIVPMNDMGTYFEENARRWLGKTVEVSGVVLSGGNNTVIINIWGFLGPPDEKKPAPLSETTLEDLLTKTGEFNGKAVKVRGQFRGQNLFGDLPSASRRHTSDWVIKEDLFAVWVTGKKPKGPGWELDAGLKRDSGKWILVTGRVHAEKGVVTIEATEVALTKEPGPKAPVEAALPPPPPPPRPKKPPVVVFSLPLDGEREVPPNTVFKVQFNKDMDEPSFKGRVVLRYAGRVQPGDRNLDAVRVSYDLGLRTLEIDPGDVLRAGRVVEILLLPGIVDVDGLPLQARPGARPGAATDVLRFQIGSPQLTGN